MKQKQKMMHRLAAMATVAATASVSTEAMATTSLRTFTSNVAITTSGIPNLISMFSYIAGIGLAVLGIFKLKQHVDAPANVPLKDALMRLGAGSMLLGLPFMTNVLQGSVANGSTTAANASGVIVSNNLMSFTNYQ